MKHLSSLTTFFVTFLFVVYLGVFSGLKVNSFISGKKLVAVQPTPAPTSKSLTVLAEAPQVNTPVQGVTTKVTPAVSAPTPAPVATTAPAEVAAPVVDVTAAPVPVVDSATPPPAPPAPAPSVPPPDPRCLITISGGQYDVTQFRHIHSGGDVFQCGTDMTAAFLSRHPASFLSKMSQYRV